MTINTRFAVARRFQTSDWRCYEGGGGIGRKILRPYCQHHVNVVWHYYIIQKLYIIVMIGYR